jgi:glycosyltransferase involved in cell wall biosynthesis
LSFPIGFGPKKLGRSPKLRKWLKNEGKTNTNLIIHSHGLWLMANIYPSAITNMYNIPLIVSPRGSLTKYAMSIGSKFKLLYWRFVQKPALENVSLFHATAESEYEDIRNMGFKQPVAIIPNGIDIPNYIACNKSNVRTLLFLGRLHPNKGLNMLLNAWKAVEDKFPDWKLIIVGPHEGLYDNGKDYFSKVLNLVKELDIKRIEFSGALYGRNKWQAYADADLFVLPSYSENFGMTVAEALASGIPAIVTKGAPWSGLESQNAGWWINIGEDYLVETFNESLSLSQEKLKDMGQNGRKWMEKDFSWQSIGQRMGETYKWLSDQSNPVPPWIKID